MESSGLPMLHYLLQQTLKSLCSCPADPSNSSSSKWVYAVFWRILPRNFPPPKFEYGGATLDRSKGNKRNWILVWEDGFCDFQECQQACKFGPDVFFKMTHEVYSYGEGIIGKVAADNGHKWVFKQNGRDNDSTIISWNVFIDPQPKAWQSQFSSGIQTISLISVREGVIQLGSLNKVEEDLNLVINIQRKFSSLLQNVPGVLSIQRPFSPVKQSLINHIAHYYYNDTTATSSSYLNEGVKPQFCGVKRSLYGQFDEVPIKSAKMGWNTPLQQNANAIPAGIASGPAAASPLWSLPPLLPNLSYCNFGAFMSKVPSTTSSAANSPPPTSNCIGGGFSPLLDKDIIRQQQQQQQQLTATDPCGPGGGGFITSPAAAGGGGGMRSVCNNDSINTQM